MKVEKIGIKAMDEVHVHVAAVYCIATAVYVNNELTRAGQKGNLLLCFTQMIALGLSCFTENSMCAYICVCVCEREFVSIYMCNVVVLYTIVYTPQALPTHVYTPQ